LELLFIILINLSLTLKSHRPREFPKKQRTGKLPSPLFAKIRATCACCWHCGQCVCVCVGVGGVGGVWKVGWWGVGGGWWVVTSPSGHCNWHNFAGRQGRPAVSRLAGWLAGIDQKALAIAMAIAVQHSTWPACHSMG